MKSETDSPSSTPPNKSIEDHLGRTLTAVNLRPPHRTEDEIRLSRAAFVMKSIAHPVRINIIRQLGNIDKLSVNQICSSLKAEQSLVSHHLSGLKSSEILSSTREGKKIFYSLEDKRVLLLLESLDQHFC